MRLDQIDLNLLMVLHTLFHTSSVTQTARQLGVSQSAVSKALSRLRAVLDDPLFIKHGNGGIAFTKRAEALREPLEDWCAATRKVLHARGSFDPYDISGRFTIATTDFGVLSVISPAMPTILSAAPGLQIKIVPLLPDSTRHLTNGSVDIALTGFAPEPARSYERWLFSERLCCVMRPDHPLAGKTDVSVSFEDLLQWPHYSPLVHDGHIDEVDSALAKAGLKRRLALQLPYFGIVPHLILNSDAIAIMPSRAATHFSETSGVAQKALPSEVAGFDYHILWSERARRDPATEWLINELATHCGTSN